MREVRLGHYFKPFSAAIWVDAEKSEAADLVFVCTTYLFCAQISEKLHSVLIELCKYLL